MFAFEGQKWLFNNLTTFLAWHLFTATYELFERECYYLCTYVGGVRVSGEQAADVGDVGIGGSDTRDTTTSVSLEAPVDALLFASPLPPCRGRQGACRGKLSKFNLSHFQFLLYIINIKVNRNINIHNTK